MTLLNSPLRYPGGKSKVAEKLVALMPTDMRYYVDLFMGGGSMMITMAQTFPQAHIYGNDLDPDVIGFFRRLLSSDAVLLQATARTVRGMSEERIRDYCEAAKERAKEGKVLDPAQFYILNQCSHGGLTTMGGLSPGFKRFTNSKIEKLTQYRFALNRGTRSIPLSNGHYMHLLYELSSRATFFFLDPPYIEAKNLYKFGDFDHAELASTLENLTSKWMLTIDDCELSRKLWSKYNVRDLPMVYGMNNTSKEGKQKKLNELLITNY